MYRVLRASVRAALHLYCGRIRVDRATAPSAETVVLLASNHPNSFFDALVIATHLPYRMRFLARGDAFRDPRAARILRALFMIPIFRMSEGRTELKRTGECFDQAHAELVQGGSVLVFSEGLSMNEPGLRPLGKGSARIAYRAWHMAGLEVRVLPVWLRYDDFHRPFMDVTLSTGEVMNSENVTPISEAVFLRGFNSTLRDRLLATGEVVDHVFLSDTRPRIATRIVLLLPAIAGMLLHAPWYFPLRGFTAWRTRGSVFFDSVLFALLFLTYPLWLLLLAWVIACAGMGKWSFVVFIAAPLLLAALRGFSRRWTSARSS